MKIRKEALLLGLIILFATSPPARAADQVPHYFPDGIERLNEPAQQWEAYLRYMNATDICRGTVGSDVNATRDFSRAITVERVFEGEKVTFYFEPWVRVKGKIVFYDFCGKTTVSEAQFQAVVDDFIGQFAQAIELGYDYHKELETVAVKAKAKRVGKSEEELRALLDKPVPDAPGVTYRELQQLPRPVKKSDFVPREVHFGYTPYFGVAWLNTETLWVTPQARIMDYLFGKPSVLLHEMTHANNNLQSYPLSNGIDVELLASTPEMLFDEDHISLSYHGYSRDTRDMVYVFFGFNFAQVRKEILIYDYAGNMKFDTAKFNEYFLKLQEVKKELRKAYLRTLEEYYSDQVFWTSFNEKLQDTRAVFRVMMSLNYDPTILNGHAETMKWLKTHHDEIMRMANQAFQNSGGESDDGESTAAKRLPAGMNIRMLEQFTGLSREEMLKLAKKYDIDVNDLKSKSNAEVIRIYLQIMERERAGAERRGR